MSISDDFKTHPAVTSGSGRDFVLNNDNRTEPQVNRRLGFEVVPKQLHALNKTIIFVEFPFK